MRTVAGSNAPGRTTPLAPVPGAPSEPPGASPADEHAERALRSAVYSWLFLPLVIGVLYWSIKAAAARRTSPPADARRFRTNIRRALLLNIAVPVLVVLALLGLSGELVGWISKAALGGAHEP